jgi:hypothetical protein
VDLVAGDHDRPNRAEDAQEDPLAVAQADAAVDARELRARGEDP